MATFTGAIETILEANSTLVTMATGGIHQLEDLGKLGLNRSLHPGSFTNGMVKPTIVVRQRSNTPTYDVVDEGNQIISARAVVEIWYYEQLGYNIINAMRDLVYPLLHDKKVS